MFVIKGCRWRPTAGEKGPQHAKFSPSAFSVTVMLAKIKTYLSPGN